MISEFFNRKNFLKDKGGFTLLEIIIVLAIISIITIISVTVFKTAQPNLNLRAATREVASDLRYAQQLAVTEQIIYSVNFNKTQGSYTITKAGGQVIKNVQINSQISINSISGLTDDTTASFTPTGAVTLSGTVTLINSAGASSSIEIKPSGYVKIQN